MVACQCVFLIVDSPAVKPVIITFFFSSVLFSLSLSFERRSATRFYHLKRRKSTRRRKRARISPLVDTRNTETLKIRANAHRKIPSERVRAKKSFKIGSRICVPFDREREKTLSGKKKRANSKDEFFHLFLSLSLCLSARGIYISPGLSRIRINILSTPTHAFAPRRVPVPSSCSSGRTRRVPSSFASTHR